jgi:hypothetical protein
LDSGNIKSLKYPNKIYDDSVWTVGTSGTQGDFTQYSTGNSIVNATDPWGNSDAVWMASNSTVPTYPSQGGIYCNAKPIDNTKLYRMSWWENRVTNNGCTYGSYYAGLNGYGSTNGVWALTNETYNTNPYFWNTTYAGLPINTWFLVVGHVWPYTYTGGVNHTDSGRYTVDGTRLGDITTDYRWGSATTTGRPRSITIYQGNAADMIHHSCHVRMDLCDGTEPSLDDLLNNVPSKVYDLSGNNNVGTEIGIPAYSSDNCGSLVFDGIDDYLKLPNDIGYTTAFSVFAWFKEVGDPGGNYHIISGGAQCEISIPIGGGLRTGLYTSDGRFVGNHGSGLVDGKYYYVGFTYNGAVKKSYINGEWVGDLNCTGVLTYSFSYRMIGQHGSSTTYHANGCIPYYHFYNRTLTEVEIKQNYNALKGRYGL